MVKSIDMVSTKLKLASCLAEFDKLYMLVQNGEVEIDDNLFDIQQQIALLYLLLRKEK